MNRKFAKLVNGAIEYAPRSFKKDGKYIFTSDEKVLRQFGYKPIVDAPPTTDDTHYALPTSWTETDDAIVRVYEVKEIEKPPRKFSKLKVVIALTQMGIWEQVKNWIVAQGLYDLYLAANEFSEDDEYFKVGVVSLQRQLDVSNEVLESILAQAEVV